MNPDLHSPYPQLASAIRALVDAVVDLQCKPPSPDFHDEERAVDCTVALLGQVRDMPEFPALHDWAAEQLGFIQTARDGMGAAE